MSILTFVARQVDGLLLAATMDARPEHEPFKRQGKQLLKKINAAGPNARCSVSAGRFVFHYMCSNGVCFMVLCEQGYPIQLAYKFLAEISREWTVEMQADWGTGWQVRFGGQR